MAFKTDGSVHAEGIANENSLKTKLENGLAKKIYQHLDNHFEVVQKGGTANKQDLEVVDSSGSRHISAKRKKGINIGSFDYVNTSAAIKKESVFDDFVQAVEELKTAGLSVTTTREKFNEMSHDMMKKISGDSLSKILKQHVNDKNRDMKIIITDSSTNTDYVYDFRDTPLYEAICNLVPRFEWGRGKTSARIVFYDSNNNKYDYGLRGRLVLNNGINALLGKSKSNKTSQPVFKVQQDKVGNMLAEIPTLQIFKGT
jgi:hypothetical protein